MRSFGGSSTGATPPSVNAGADQTSADLSAITLNGSATAGSTVAWTLHEARGADVTASLSSSSVLSPTFSPSDGAPGVYTAELSATKGGLTSKDTTLVRVGDNNGWIRANPDVATSTYSGGRHSSVTWSDDGSDWTTVTLSARSGGTVLRPEHAEIKFFEPVIPNIATVFSIEWKITSDESFSQPLLTDYTFAGIVIGNTSDPTTATGMYQAYTVTNQSQITKATCRGMASNIAWSGSVTGYDSLQGALSFRPYYGAHQRATYNKTTVAGSSHVTEAATSITFSPSVTWSDPLRIGLMAGRSGSTSGDKTFKFQLFYRVHWR